MGCYQGAIAGTSLERKHRENTTLTTIQDIAVSVCTK